MWRLSRFDESRSDRDALIVQIVPKNGAPRRMKMSKIASPMRCGAQCFDLFTRGTTLLPGR
jgi:hypothetical protein